MRVNELEEYFPSSSNTMVTGQKGQEVTPLEENKKLYSQNLDLLEQIKGK